MNTLLKLLWIHRRGWAITLLALISGVAHAAAPLGAWWYTNFDFRYKINVPAGASALATGYAVSITFDHATAVTAGNSLASGDDVRIVRWTGAAWVELDRILDPDSSWNTATTKIWFKTQAAIATSVTDDNYYLYYGDTAVTNTPLQDPDNIFSLYDDFEGTFDTAKWSRSNNTNVTVAGGVLTVNGTRQIRSVATFGINTIFEVRAAVSTASPSNPNYYLAGDNDCTDYVFDSYIRFRADNTASDTLGVSPGTVAAPITFTVASPTTQQLFSFTREAAGAGRFLYNGSQVSTYSGATTTNMCMFMRNEASAAQTQVYEWARVRPYRAIEPVPTLPTLETLAMPAPVGDWRLDQTTWTAAAGQVIDSSGNGLHMTAMNAPTTANSTPPIAGDPGTCRYGNFNGTNQYLQVADNALLDITNQLTVTVWVYARALGTDLTSILSKDTNYEFHINSAGRVYWWWGGAPQELTSTTTVPLNTWVHIALTYESGVQRLYINGVLRGTNNQTGALTTNALPLQIAQDQGLADRFFNGLIDEVKIYNAALSSAQVKTVMTATHPCSTPTHFKISHDGFGITCLATETVTVDVHDALHNAVTGYSQLMVLDTQTGHGTWTLLSGSGTFTDATANDGQATYQWDGTQSQARFALDYRSSTGPLGSPGTLTFDIDAYQFTNTLFRDDDTEGTMTFSPSGFIVTSVALSNSPPIPIPAFANQIAGTSFGAYLTAYGQTPTDPTCGVIEGYTGPHTIKFWPTYSNPNTGTLGISANNGVAYSGNNEAAAVSQSITFTAGQSPLIAPNIIQMRYKDAGQIAINVKDDATINASLPLGVRGSSSNFVVKPSTFVITAIPSNPANSASTGPIFVKAGRPFSATVEARDATGSVTPNYGKEIPAESVSLTPALIAPAGSHNPAIIAPLGFGAFSAGSATGSDFSWPEVGTITLTPHVKDSDYLGAGDVTGVTSLNVGRFTPDHFDMSASTPIFQTACNMSATPFTYWGQPFRYATAPVVTITAKAFGNQTTQNYTGTYFKLSTSSITRTFQSTDPLDTTAIPVPEISLNDLGSLIPVNPINGGIATALFTLGSTSAQGLAYARAASPVPPTTTPAAITLQVSVTDSDSVASTPAPYVVGSPGIAFNISSRLRYGRVAFRNGVGSELLNLPLPLHTEYFVNSTSGFVQNTDDSCTTGVTIPVSPSPSAPVFGGNLSSSKTCMLDTGNPGVSGFGCAAAGPAGQQFRATALAGDFVAILKAPGAGNGGTVTVTADVPTWLRFDWNALNPGQENPSGIATFGIFQGESKRIFQTEKY